MNAPTFRDSSRVWSYLHTAVNTPAIRRMQHGSAPIVLFSDTCGHRLFTATAVLLPPYRFYSELSNCACPRGCTHHHGLDGREGIRGPPDVDVHSFVWQLQLIQHLERAPFVPSSMSETSSVFIMTALSWERGTIDMAHAHATCTIHKARCHTHTCTEYRCEGIDFYNSCCRCRTVWRTVT